MMSAICLFCLVDYYLDAEWFWLVVVVRLMIGTNKISVERELNTKQWLLSADSIIRRAVSVARE